MFATAVGFGALAVSDIRPVHDMGLWTACGLVVAWIGCFTLFPALQSLLHLSLRAGLALSYLIVAGSLLGFTAYVWLLARMPATLVASHAYVNPLVAVALGYFVAGEVLTVRMMLAAVLVVASVFLILTTPEPRGRRS